MRPGSQKFYRQILRQIPISVFYLLQTCSTREVLLQYSGENAGIPQKSTLASATSEKSAKPPAASGQEPQEAALPAHQLRPQASEGARGQTVQESQLL